MADTVGDLKKGDPFPPNGKVWHIRPVGNGWLSLRIERDDRTSYATLQHEDTPLADAYGGGYYEHDVHLAFKED